MLFNFAWKQFTFTSVSATPIGCRWCMRCARTVVCLHWSHIYSRSFFKISTSAFVFFGQQDHASDTFIHKLLNIKLRGKFVTVLINKYCGIPRGCPKFAFTFHMVHDTIKFTAERKTKTKIRSAQLFRVILLGRLCRPL